MQTALNRGCHGAVKPLDARRSVVRVPAFGTTASRRTSVQVFAKGKGKAFRQGTMPSQMEMVRREPPVPEVDPENEQFVIFVRCMKYYDPTVKAEMGPSQWAPVNLISGSAPLNFVARTVMGSQWGSKLYSRTLIWQIGMGLYANKAELERKMRKEVPFFATANQFQYAFKIRDKANPKDWSKAEQLIIIPPKEELGNTGLDAVKKFFSLESLAAMFKSPDAPAA